MKGLFGWFENRVNQKLRKSQIKVIYQNYHATIWLIDQHQSFLGAGYSEAREALETLKMFGVFIDDCILQLAWQTVLPDNEAAQLLQINNGLKSLYSENVAGKMQARALLGRPAGDRNSFADRFSPAGGWSNFSEKDWEAMMHGAIARLPKEQVP